MGQTELCTYGGMSITWLWNVMNIITGYDRVLDKLSDITAALKLNPGARDKLTSLYHQKKWLEITENPDEEKLVRLALVRIKQDPSQFEPFIKMLGGIKGVDVTAKILGGESEVMKGGELSCSLYLIHTGHCAEKGTFEIQPRPGALLYMKM